ncbi:MAG TPA: arabinofuranosidase catalytic domain-containing protein [Actinocrinis sp.]
MARGPSRRRRRSTPFVRRCRRTLTVLLSLALVAGLTSAVPAGAAAAARIPAVPQAVAASDPTTVTAPSGDVVLTVDGGDVYDPTVMQQQIDKIQSSAPHLSDAVQRLFQQSTLLDPDGDFSAGLPVIDGTLSMTSDDSGISLTIPAAEAQQTSLTFWQGVAALVITLATYLLIFALCTALGGPVVTPFCGSLGASLGNLVGGIFTVAVSGNTKSASAWLLVLATALSWIVGASPIGTVIGNWLKETGGPLLLSLAKYLGNQASTAWAWLGPKIAQNIGAVAGVLTVIAGGIAALVTQLTGSSSGLPSGSLECDIYMYYGTGCVAAYSTVHALSATYDGPLYQVTRASDGATQDIGLQSTGGYVDASEQHSFCDQSTCAITKIYDQSSEQNDLTPGPGGSAAPAPDQAASAGALPITAGGNEAFGVDISGGVGYRNDNPSAIAQGSNPEGMYMVASGTHVNAGCCFDFGNAEKENSDKGNGHMDAVNLNTRCYFTPCTDTGPWVQADLENGLFQGGNGNNPNNLGNKSNYVTAMLKNDGTTTYALKGGDAQGGGLSTWWEGPLPDPAIRPGYKPMQKEGAIILGIGGDNSNSSIGSFFEGAMTAGYPSDTADNAVQNAIVSVGYAGSSGGVTPVAGTITSSTGKCVDVFGDDDGVAGTRVDLWDCQPGAVDQHWTRNTDGSLETLGLCLDTVGAGTAAGALTVLAQCTGQGGTQIWVQQPDGSLLNKVSGLCLGDPSGSSDNGTQLQLAACDGARTTKYSLNGGTPIVGPSGKCLDVYGDDTGGDRTPVDLWDCQPNAVDQHWIPTAGGQLVTLGKCLDVKGDATAPGTLVQLYSCDGSPGQVWRNKPDKLLVNPGSGLCLTSPDNGAANSTQLEINTCTGGPNQTFPVYDASLWQPQEPVTFDTPGNSNKCLDVKGDDSGGVGTPVDLWDCQPGAADQHWDRNADGSLLTLGLCLDTVGHGTTSGTKVVLATCTGQGGTQLWAQEPDGSILDKAADLCLDDSGGNTANGTQLQIYTCNEEWTQKFDITGGSPIANPDGKCMDVLGDDTGGDKTPVDLWDCQTYAVDQHWTYNSAAQTLTTLGKCLDVKGDSTVAGTPVQLYDCNGNGGQVWQELANGALLNPQSDQCLDDPNGNSANGTRLRIWTCDGAPAQHFPIYIP